MDKHTPGPWAFYTEPQPNGCPIVGARGLMVCMLAHTVNQPEQRGEALANAALIAAAPDLLEALRNADKLITQLMPGVRHIVLQDYGFLNDTLMANTAAIAKATGVKHG